MIVSVSVSVSYRSNRNRSCSEYFDQCLAQLSFLMKEFPGCTAAGVCFEKVGCESLELVALDEISTEQKAVNSYVEQKTVENCEETNK